MIAIENRKEISCVVGQSLRLHCGVFTLLSDFSIKSYPSRFICGRSLPLYKWKFADSTGSHISRKGFICFYHFIDVYKVWRKVIIYRYDQLSHLILIYSEVSIFAENVLCAICSSSMSFDVIIFFEVSYYFGENWKFIRSDRCEFIMDPWIHRNLCDKFSPWFLLTPQKSSFQGT